MINIKKLLAVGIILLFIGIVFTSGISADLPKTYNDSELVEITIGEYRAEGIRNHIVQLAREDAVELEKLVDTIEKKLDNVSSKNEFTATINDALESLYTFGLLDYSSLNQMKDVFTKLSNIQHKNLNNKEDLRYNVLCFLAGRTNMRITPIGFIPGFSLAIYIFLKVLDGEGTLLNGIIFFSLVGYFLLNQYFPIRVLNFAAQLDSHSNSSWITSLGLNGFQKWTDGFYLYMLFFSGIKITLDTKSLREDEDGFHDSFLLGTALILKDGIY